MQAMNVPNAQLAVFVPVDSWREHESRCCLAEARLSGVAADVHRHYTCRAMDAGKSHADTLLPVPIRAHVLFFSLPLFRS
jgi:hypothetical protein